MVVRVWWQLYFQIIKKTSTMSSTAGCCFSQANSLGRLLIVLSYAKVMKTLFLILLWLWYIDNKMFTEYQNETTKYYLFWFWDVFLRCVYTKKIRRKWEIGIIIYNVNFFNIQNNETVHQQIYCIHNIPSKLMYKLK